MKEGGGWRLEHVKFLAMSPATELVDFEGAGAIAFAIALNIDMFVAARKPTNLMGAQILVEAFQPLQVVLCRAPSVPFFTRLTIARSQCAHCSVMKASGHGIEILQNGLVLGV